MEAKKILIRAMQEAQKKLLPPPDLTISEWADRFRYLGGERPEPGPWRTSRTPYLRKIMDALCDPNVEEVVFKASSQVGKSEVLNNTIGYYVHLDPGPIMLVQPRIEDAENYSKGRIAPMIRDTPVLRKRIAPVRSKDSDNSILLKSFPGGRLRLAGSNAPASLASDSVRILLMDEVDRMAVSSGTEGDPYMLAKKRTATFKRRKKIGSFSSPTEKKTSRIEQRWNESDKNFWKMPCPHCQKLITFEWKRFKWDDGKPETVVYLCQECDAVIEEKHKPKMLEEGDFVPTADFKGTAGFYIWEAYSPWVPWKDIVSAFLKVKDYPESLKVWINTSLGECWEQKEGDIQDWKRLHERREKYAFDSIPEGAHFLTAGADVQADRIEVEVVGWGKNLESWSICYRVFMGDTSKDEVWKDLEKMLSEQWVKPDKTQLSIRLMGVDSGFNTSRVYNWVRKFSQNRVIATKGNANLDSSFAPPKPVDISGKTGKRIRRGVMLWQLGVNVIKSEIMGFLRADLPGDDGAYPPGFCHFPQYGEDHFKQLTAEHLELRRDARGHGHWEWVKHHERNEQLDCRVIARACAAILQIDRMKESDWDRLANKNQDSGSAKPKAREERKPQKKPRESIW